MILTRIIISRVKFILFFFIIGGTIFSSCSKDDKVTTIPSDNLSEQQNVFQEFWNLYDLHYPLFHRKNIDWQEVHNTYYSQITATTTDSELFDIFNTIIATVIRDGHSSVTFNNIQETQFEPDFNQEVQSMIQNNREEQVNIVSSSANNAYLSYGTLVKDENIGYIHSKRFEPLSESDSEFAKFKSIVDEALQALQDKKGIVLDIRTNGGGQGQFAYYLAGRFFSESTPLDLVRMRYKLGTGSTEDALSDWVTTNFEGYPDSRAEGGTIGSIFTDDFTVSSSGAFQFTNKVAVLTSRGTASAAEYFTAAMKNQNHVKSIGNKTFGIFAGSEHVTFNSGNGKWNTRISVQDVELFYEGSYQSFEGEGITPDEVVLPTLDEVNNGTDVHIEAAMNYIISG